MLVTYHSLFSLPTNEGTHLHVIPYNSAKLKTKLNSVARVREGTILTERLPLVNYADTGCHEVSVTYPHGRILGFLYRSRYLFFQVAPQLYSRG
jgi:hypothetical protein